MDLGRGGKAKREERDWCPMKEDSRSHSACREICREEGSHRNMGGTKSEERKKVKKDSVGGGYGGVVRETFSYITFLGSELGKNQGFRQGGEGKSGSPS